MSAPPSDDDVRFSIAAARRMLYRQGCDSGTAGHVSVRAADGTGFWVTPFQYFDETLPSDVQKVGFDLRITDEGESQGPPVSPAVAFHAEIYQARPDVGCVIHHHGHWTSVLSSTGTPVGVYHIVSSLFFEDQAVASDDDTGSGVEAGHLSKALGPDKHVVLIRNHGCVVVGSGIEDTTIKALTLEQSARVHLDAVAAGGIEVEPTHARYYKGNFERYFLPEMWEAHLRRLRRSDPDLFA